MRCRTNLQIETNYYGFVQYHRYGAKNDETIISEIHDKYQNLYDFLEIERDYRVLNIGAFILNIFLGLVLGLTLVLMVYCKFWDFDLAYTSKLGEHIVKPDRMPWE